MTEDPLHLQISGEDTIDDDEESDSAHNFIMELDSGDEGIVSYANVEDLLLKIKSLCNQHKVSYTLIVLPKAFLMTMQKSPKRR